MVHLKVCCFSAHLTISMFVYKFKAFGASHQSSNHFILGYIGVKVWLFMQFSEQFFTCKYATYLQLTSFCFNTDKYEKSSSLKLFMMMKSQIVKVSSVLKWRVCVMTQICSERPKVIKPSIESQPSPRKTVHLYKDWPATGRDHRTEIRNREKETESRLPPPVPRDYSDPSCDLLTLWSDLRGGYRYNRGVSRSQEGIKVISGNRRRKTTSVSISLSLFLISVRWSLPVAGQSLYRGTVFLGLGFGWAVTRCWT
jgi:hypothetical protein